MSFNIKEIKEQLSSEQVYNYLCELGAEPIDKDNVIVCKTICHNGLCDGTHKLYYYKNTHLFHCYTECSDSFDIATLTHKAVSMKDSSFQLYDAVKYIANYFGFSASLDNESGFKIKLKDQDVFDRYAKLQKVESPKQIELRYYDNSILKHLPRPRIIPWLKEGMTQNVLDNADICYDPVNEGIIIPHYDINKNLIGIRERTLVQEKEKYGKYMPAILDNKMYNHPLSFSLYNLWNSKQHIKNMKKVIVFESEKSTLLYGSYFGLENDISVACCGSNLIRYQFNLLKELGVEEIIIAFDRQFKEIGDKECQQWIKKLTEINNKYSNEITISFMFDKNNYLGYKDSPIDCGPDIFLQMFKERSII